MSACLSSVRSRGLAPSCGKCHGDTATGKLRATIPCAHRSDAAKARHGGWIMREGSLTSSISSPMFLMEVCLGGDRSCAGSEGSVVETKATGSHHEPRTACSCNFRVRAALKEPSMTVNPGGSPV